MESNLERAEQGYASTRQNKTKKDTRVYVALVYSTYHKLLQFSSKEKADLKEIRMLSSFLR
jgi:hypothetical protein